VVNVVVLSSGPERQEVVQAPGELVAAVGIDGLGQTEHNPDVHGKDVKVLGDGAPNDGDTDRTETQDHDLNRRSVFSGETEGSRVLVMDLVDVLVQERACVHSTVHPIVPCIFEDEEDGDLVCHLVDARERNRGLEAEVLAHRVEQPDLREFDSKVGKEDEEGALSLLPTGGDLVLGEVSFGPNGSIVSSKRTCWIL
jgi:hypothetical protein